MISEFIKTLISAKELLISVVFALIGLLIINYNLFKNYPLKVVIKYWLGTVFTLLITIKLLLVAYFIVSFFSNSFVTQYLALSVLFTLVYFTNLSLKTLLDLKSALPKAKKMSSLKDVLDNLYSENFSRTLNLLVVSSILILSTFFLGNGKINNLLILLSLSVFITSISTVFLLPLILRFSDWLFNLVK
jgi:hypothetical protein